MQTVDLTVDNIQHVSGVFMCKPVDFTVDNIQYVSGPYMPTG